MQVGHVHFQYGTFAAQLANEKNINAAAVQMKKMIIQCQRLNNEMLQRNAIHNYYDQFIAINNVDERKFTRAVHASITFPPSQNKLIVSLQNNGDSIQISVISAEARMFPGTAPAIVCIFNHHLHHYWVCFFLIL